MTTVMMVTHSGDELVPTWVAEAVRRRGGRVCRLDTDAYPTGLDLQVRTDGVWLDGQRVQPDAVWLHRLWPALLPDELPDAVVEAVRREARDHLTAAVDVWGLQGARLVDDPDAVRRVAGHKVRQLAVAESVGLRTVPTLVSNDPDAVRAFVARCGGAGEVVAKLHGPVPPSLRGAHPVGTQVVDADAVEHLDGLRYGPMAFQERVRAERELRVCWVGGRVFVGAQSCVDGVDWRTRGGGWSKGELDADTSAAVDRLMARLGLRMGSLDLMVPEDGGEPVFLEVNPSGEWGMLQGELGLKVADAVAELLVEASCAV